MSLLRDDRCSLCLGHNWDTSLLDCLDCANSDKLSLNYLVTRYVESYRPSVEPAARNDWGDLSIKRPSCKLTVSRSGHAADLRGGHFALRPRFRSLLPGSGPRTGSTEAMLYIFLAMVLVRYS